MDNNYLAHYGILGMKWGVRRSKAQLARAKGESYHEDYKRVHDKKSVKYMSDKELADRNKRLQAERQYNQMTKKTSVGEKAVKTFIATAGTIVAAEAAYKTYKRVGDGIVNKVGDWFMDDITKAMNK